MKKILSLLSTITIVSSCGSNLISCKDENYREIYLVTDSGKINDRSFNQSGYEAGNSFVKDILKVNKKIGYNEPVDGNGMKNAYSLSVTAGAKAIILPGYIHGGFIDIISNDLGDKASAVFIDGSTGVNSQGKNNTNIIGLTYRTDVSGFYTALSSIIWYFQTHKDEKEVTLATFGGQANPIAVTPYLVGYFAAIEFFNMIENESSDVADLFIKNYNLRKGLTAKRVKNQISDPTGETDQNFFTNSFAAGDGKQISDVFISNGANIIFPVAGPQTADVLGAIVEHNKDNVYIDGVDTDQIHSYPTYSSYFITSGLKNIKGSTMVALAHTKYFSNIIDEDTLKKIEELGGVDRETGIELNKNSEKNGEDKNNWKNAHQSWDGLNVWFTGDFAYSDATDKNEKNKITKEVHDSLTKFMEDNFYLQDATLQYFDDVDAGKNSTQLLSNSYIDRWLKALVNGVQK